MQHDETLSHTKWDCKYHVIFIPKYRPKALRSVCVSPALRERPEAEHREYRVRTGRFT